MTQLLGGDVSDAQSNSQIMAAVENGCKFMVIKASEGRGADLKLTTHLRKVHDAQVALLRGKVLLGHYHYGWACNSPVADANNFLASAKARPGDLLVLDLEETHDGCTWHQRLIYALAWLDYVKQTTHASPVLYLNVTWMTNLVRVATPDERKRLTSYPLWIADPSSPAGHPHVVGWQNWTLNQYGETGNVDRDILNGSSGTWLALAVPPVKVETTPAPAPTPIPLPPAPAPAPTPEPPKETKIVDTIIYTRRDSLDTPVAAWAAAAKGHDVLASVDLAFVKAEAALGARIIAVGTDAVADLAGVPNVVTCDGANALDSGAKLVNAVIAL